MFSKVTQKKAYMDKLNKKYIKLLNVSFER